eukprot:scaffold110632_cov49-Phaeocystis_antarctica.AAC.1
MVEAMRITMLNSRTRSARPGWSKAVESVAFEAARASSGGSVSRPVAGRAELRGHFDRAVRQLPGPLLSRILAAKRSPVRACRTRFTLVRIRARAGLGLGLGLGSGSVVRVRVKVPHALHLGEVAAADSALVVEGMPEVGVRRQPDLVRVGIGIRVGVRVRVRVSARVRVRVGLRVTVSTSSVTKVLCLPLLGPAAAAPAGTAGSAGTADADTAACCGWACCGCGCGCICGCCCCCCICVPGSDASRGAAGAACSVTACPCIWPCVCPPRATEGRIGLARGLRGTSEVMLSGWGIVVGGLVPLTRGAG